VIPQNAAKILVSVRSCSTEIFSQYIDSFKIFICKCMLLDTFYTFSVYATMHLYSVDINN